jgi:hypothetical protein
MNRFESDIQRALGEILKEQGFSFASDLSPHPSDSLVYRSAEILLRFSWDRGDVLIDVSTNQDIFSWYPLQHVVQLFNPAFNFAGKPPQVMIAHLAEEQWLIRSLDNDLKSVAPVLSHFLPRIKEKLAHPDYIALARLQELSDRAEKDTIERIFKKQ